MGVNSNDCSPLRKQELWLISLLRGGLQIGIPKALSG